MVVRLVALLAGSGYQSLDHPESAGKRLFPRLKEIILQDRPEADLSTSDLFQSFLRLGVWEALDDGFHSILRCKSKHVLALLS